MKTRMKTNDVALLDDGETWGGPGKIVRMTPAVERKYRDDLDNGGLDDVIKDRRVEILHVEVLVEIFDRLRQIRSQDPTINRLLKEAVYARAGQS